MYKKKITILIHLIYNSTSAFSYRSYYKAVYWDLDCTMDINYIPTTPYLHVLLVIKLLGLRSPVERVPLLINIQCADRKAIFLDKLHIQFI